MTNNLIRRKRQMRHKSISLLCQIDSKHRMISTVGTLFPLAPSMKLRYRDSYLPA